MSRSRHHALAFLPLVTMAVPCAAGPCQVGIGTHVLPLVELYTAEGCNQCPPADRWFSDMFRRTQSTQAALLAFHVDYWDEAGWPDRFADHAYSQRQDLRIRLAKKNVTYTPQIMVGKDVRVEWKDASRLQSMLERVRARPASVGLSLDVSGPEEALRVGIEASRATGESTEPLLVWLALYEDGLESRIDAGENKGLVLPHDRVVRALVGPWRMGLALFAESATTGEGMQALALPPATCVAPGRARAEGPDGRSAFPRIQRSRKASARRAPNAQGMPTRTM